MSILKDDKDVDLVVILFLKGSRMEGLRPDRVFQSKLRLCGIRAKLLDSEAFEHFL